MAKNLVTVEGSLTADTRQKLNDGMDDVSYCTTQLDATSSTTLANITGMVTDVLQPGTYRFSIHLSGTAGASGGIKVAFKFGAASMLTSLEAQAKAFTTSGVVTARANTATDQASLVASTSAATLTEIIGVVVVGTAGTLQLQAAQNASNATTTSIYTNSFMFFKKIA